MKQIRGSPLPTYVEDMTHVMAPVFLPDDSYALGLQAFVLACTDVLFIDREAETFYLARRKSRPAKDWWWFIGGRRRAGETTLKSIQRCVKRETGLIITENRFRFVDLNEYFFVDREQEPHCAGTHSLAHTFCVEIAENEIRSIKLDADEYHDGGLKEFALRDLKRLELRRPVKDIVEKAFAPKANTVTRKTFVTLTVNGRKAYGDEAGTTTVGVYEVGDRRTFNTAVKRASALLTRQGWVAPSDRVLLMQRLMAHEGFAPIQTPEYFVPCF